MRILLPLCLVCLLRRQRVEHKGPTPRNRCRILPIEPRVVRCLGLLGRGRLPIMPLSRVFLVVRSWVPQLALGQHRNHHRAVSVRLVRPRRMVRTALAHVDCVTQEGPSARRIDLCHLLRVRAALVGWIFLPLPDCSLPEVSVDASLVSNSTASCSQCPIHSREIASLPLVFHQNRSRAMLLFRIVLPRLLHHWRIIWPRLRNSIVACANSDRLTLS